MKAFRVVLLALAAVPFVAVHADEPKDQAGLSCIKDIQFSHEFLEKYPNAAPACREVKIQNGEKWARFETKVKSVSKGKVTVNVLNVRGDSLAEVTVAPAADAKLKIEGKESKYSSLRPGDTLDLWMPENRFGFYSEAGAAKVNELPIVARDEKK